jgi:hypothetical protein
MPFSKFISLAILITLSSSIVSHSQEKTSEVFFACNYTSNAINEKAICDMLGFQTRPEAQKAVENIVRRSGLKQNFYVMECPNIDNCFAATRNGERLIVYDAGFMKRVNGITKTDWGAMSVLAHEIGHHLQGHTLKQSGSDPQKELEADEFSGFVMYQMGASLKEAQSAIYMLTTDQDYGTHPPRRKRLAAIARGFDAATELYPRINASDNSVDSDFEEPKLEQTKEVIVFEEPEITPKRVPKSNPTIKTGCIEGSCKNGFGIAINTLTYERYEGNWNNGRRSGYGIEYYADGLKKFEGNFSGSTFHGFGTYFYTNGDKYVGNFKKGTPHDDNSIYYYKNGDRLFARYINGKKEGKAKKLFYSGVEKTVYFREDKEVDL